MRIEIELFIAAAAAYLAFAVVFNACTTTSQDNAYYYSPLASCEEERDACYLQLRDCD